MADPWKKWRAEFGAETDYIIKLWSCFSDPEQKESFLQTVREKKKSSSRYSIYDDWPRAESATRKAREECCEFVKSLRRPKEENGEEWDQQSEKIQSCEEA